MKITKIKFNVETFFLICLFVGFLVISKLPDFLGIPDIQFSIPYRIFVVFIAVVIILKGILTGNLLKRVSFAVFLFFMMMYLSRMFYDLYINPIILFADNTAEFYIQQLVGIVLLPSIALFFLNVQNLNYQLIFNFVFWSLIIILGIELTSFVNSGHIGRSHGALVLGVQYYGHFGCTLSLLSAYNFLYGNKKNKKSRLITFFGFFIGLITIFISASRSPFLALCIGVLFMMGKKMKSINSVLISIVVLFFGIFFFWDIVGIINTYFPNDFFMRLEHGINTIDEEGGRNSLLSYGVNEFLESPIIGNHFLIQTVTAMGTYPHNLIIESFMALGIIGGGILVIWIIGGVKTAYKSFGEIREDGEWITLLFLQHLIFGMVSGNLYSSDGFWIYSVLVMIGFNSKKLQIDNDNNNRL